MCPWLFGIYWFLGQGDAFAWDEEAIRTRITMKSLKRLSHHAWPWKTPGNWWRKKPNIWRSFKTSQGKPNRSTKKVMVCPIIPSLTSYLPANQKSISAQPKKAQHLVLPFPCILLLEKEMIPKTSPTKNNQKNPTSFPKLTTSTLPGMFRGLFKSKQKEPLYMYSWI